jgi:hypothetical protein
MPAIGKGQRNEQQGFMYRGHDDVMNALNPLLSIYRVFFVPKVLERVPAQRTTNQGKVMYEVNLHVEYTFYGPLGDSFSASAWGEGTDSGDKSTNKAMTMALKNVLAQVFAVSTAEQAAYDTDQHADPETVAEFDPSQKIVPGAPTGWALIQTMILDLDRTLSEWVAEAIFKTYGTQANEIKDAELKRQAFCRTSNAVYRVAAELFKDGDFPPPSDDDYRKVFAWAFDGVHLDGPGTPFDDPDAVAEFEQAVAADDEPAATGGQESGADAAAQEEPTPARENVFDGLGDQAHIGTAAPDE